MTEVTTSALLSMFKEVYRWTVDIIANRKRRGARLEKALDDAGLAARETLAYVERLPGGQNDDREIDLALKWFGLSIELRKLRFAQLSKTCDIKSKYWATRKRDGSSALDQDFLDDAKTNLDAIEKAVQLAQLRAG